MLAMSLKQLRTSKKMTLKKLSKKAKISVPYLSALERGERNNPSALILSDLAKALGVTYETLAIALVNDNDEERCKENARRKQTANKNDSKASSKGIL